MIGTIALVTDSNGLLPTELLDRYGVDVVPLSVLVDGVPHEEGVDLDVDEFFAHMGEAGREVATAHPSPEAFAAAYARAVERGATAILSVHIGVAMSGTINAARVAATDAGVPVRLVDTGTVSFGVAGCLWKAADALVAGASLEEAAAVAERAADEIGNVFVLRALDPARGGGRVLVAHDAEASRAGEIQILTIAGGKVEVVGSAGSIDSAADAMAGVVLDRASDGPLRVAVGHADITGAPLADALYGALADDPAVEELLRFRVAPSVAVHSGPGVAGAVFLPA